MDLSDVTGPFGPFQKRILFVLLTRPISWALLMTNYLFINQKVNFNCETNSELRQSEENVTLAFNNECDRLMDKNVTLFGGLDFNLDLNSTVKCNKFVYDTDKTYTTVTEEWDLVCSREWLISFGYMVFSIGNFVAYLPTGQIADKIGRKPMLLIGQGTITIASFIVGFSNSITMFLVLRFLIGFGYGVAQNPFMVSYVESVGPEHRDLLVYSFTALWGVGTMVLSCLAWLIREWRTLLIVCSIPFQLPLLILIYWWIPESTRWLLSTKRFHRAEAQLKTQAKQNGKVIEDIEPIMEKLIAKIELDQNADHASFLDLLKNKHLRKTAAILYISYISTVFIDHGFMLSLALESGSIYLNVFLSGAVDIPVVFFYYMTVKYFNRRQGLLVSFIVTGIIFLAVIPISDDMLWLKLTFTLLGRMSNTLAYVLIYVFANELFPTNLRAVAVSGAMTSGRIGSILCPFADLIGRFYGNSYPIILYGCLSLLTSAIFFLLPETQHKHLPDTVLDFERLASDKRQPNQRRENNDVKLTEMNNATDESQIR